MSREAFLQRVRQAAHSGRAHRIHPHGEVTERTGYVGASGDVCRHMATEVEAVGGHAHLVGDLRAARDLLEGLLVKYEVKTALCWQHDLLNQLGLDELLSTRGIGHIDFDSLSKLDLQQQRQTCLAADIGITSASCAIAETGTLVMLSAPGRERTASLVPPVHVAIIQRSQILADLFDLFAQLEQDGIENMPSNLSLITGPSKTGDIELQLTTGIHGPGTWHVIIAEG